MGDIGNYGDISFYCRTKKRKLKVLSFHDMSRSASANYSEHERNGEKPFLEHTGDGLDMLTLSIEASAVLGIKPLKVEKQLYKMKSSGTAEYFVLGGTKVGSYPYVITNIEETYRTFSNDGRIISLGFDVTLKEYPNETSKTKKTATTTKSSTTKSTIVTDGEVKEPKVKSSTTYTVLDDDTLWGIAKKFYGKGQMYTKIYNANKDKIKNPNLIYPGQILTIPA